MRDRCWNCRKWEEHFYWDHFEESSFRFLKVMDGDFSQRMEFPLKFSKNFRVDLIEVVSLNAQSGQSWEIDLHKEQDRFFFKGGGRVGSSNICTQELNDLSSYSWSNVNSALVYSKRLINTLLHNFAGKRWKSSFVKLITKSNINGLSYLTIPKKFISDHIPQKPNAITICNKKKKWLLRCRGMHNCWGFVGTSLLNFFKENNLKEGDACVFNLKERNKNVVMEMHVLQAKEVVSILKNSCC
ncbi:B3 domain-containing protein [Platanthera zijinensis]|uniref:B3 domain-containing protein n=1 Tax=Platanthera zijinensis TaxID=2320716 RepID=A0AAP0GE72_9ASPA